MRETVLASYIITTVPCAVTPTDQTLQSRTLGPIPLQSEPTDLLPGKEGLRGKEHVDKAGDGSEQQVNTEKNEWWLWWGDFKSTVPINGPLTKTYEQTSSRGRG